MSYWICICNYEVYTLQNVLITSSGAWKLGGFGFAISTDQASGDMANVPAFHYAVSEFFDWIRK
jgi:hypothetical protein